MGENFKRKIKKKEINYKRNLKKCWLILKDHWYILIGVMILLFISNAIGFFQSYLFKELIDNGTIFIDKSITKENFISILYLIGAGFLLSRIILISITWATQSLQMNLEKRYLFDLRKKYFNHVLNLSHKFHSSHNAGELISKLGRGSSSIVRFVDNTFWNFTPFISQLILIMFSFGYFSFRLLLVLAGTMIAFFLSSYIILKKQQKVLASYNNSQDSENRYISNSLTNIESIKLFGKERDISKIFTKKTKRTIDYSIAQWNYYKYFDLTKSLIFGIGTFLLMYISIQEFISGSLSLGDLSYIYTTYLMFIGTINNFVFGIRGAYESLTNMQGIFDYEEIENEIKDKSGAKNLKIKEGSVEFRNISFSYPEKNGKGKKIFEDFSLSIRPKEKVALVGHSGSGKTTVVKLLNRFYDVNSGEILIDGEKIKDYKQESVRSETGIVPQEAILFGDTIYNNIRFARPNATKEEILQAIKLAQLDKIIKGFPKGINTIVGERGVKLSGGERQRVSIARAILANKKILVLDEATSALDSVTENQIQNALDKLLEGRTSIIIAHRLSTIMKADRIIVMDKGKIVEAGTHSELLKRKGEYYKLWNMQSGGYLPDGED